MTISSRTECESLDRDDAMRFARARFALPTGVIYLDGNSLGPLPVATADALSHAVNVEWGMHLIRAWNDDAWIGLPQSVGAQLAPLLGAAADEVIVCDSTSVNLFKLLAAVLMRRAAQPGGPVVVLMERDNFPTDLYIAEGVQGMLGGRFALKRIAGEPLEALDASVAVAVLTQVDYRTGRLLDMAAIERRAREVGADVIWDLSHSAGAVPLALGREGCRFAVGCGYKYLNGGPGAPAYLYMARSEQSHLGSPISGWFGHAAPFAFEPEYRPAASLDRFLAGTPSVLAIRALQNGIATFDGIDMSLLRCKSLALTALFRALVDSRCAGHGLHCVTPQEPAQRGSQLAFAHDDAYAVMQALIDRGVIGDFRAPNLLRFGFTPLYTRHVDCWDAVEILREIMVTESWRAPKYQQRRAVT